MNIDFRVNPAFYLDIKRKSETENISRHKGFEIYKNSFAPILHIRNQMKVAKLDKLVLSSEDRSSEFTFPLVSNHEIKELIDLYPKEFIGIGSCDILKENYQKVAEEALTDLNLSGLKVNLGVAKIYPNDQRVIKLLDICKKFNKPIIFDCGVNWEKESISKFIRPIEFEEIVKEYSMINICLTQFGWPWVEETASLMLKHRNLYTDTGLLYFDSAGEFYKDLFNRKIPITWIDRSLRHQVMFASGNPRFEQIRMFKALDNLSLRNSTKILIKGKNAMEFLGVNYDS